MTVEEASISSPWSRDEDKAFENALATYSEDSVDFWDKIASDLPGKTLEEIKRHYDLLLDDVNRIESGRIPLPSYNSLSDGPAGVTWDEGSVKKGGHVGNVNGEGIKGSKAEQERRKGIAWTEEEHRLFLLGLEKYGKGDWRSISRNFVVTRTPTQVASHAQKYFIRLNSVNKDRRRSSIHDITSVNNDDSANQGPITGTGNGNGNGAGGASGKPSKQSPQSPAARPAVGIYGTPTIGQPIGGPIASAVGTPVTGHMAFGVKAPVQGSVGSSTPASTGPGTYPTRHAKAHR